MSLPIQKSMTLKRVYTSRGIKGVLALFAEKAKMIWRQGEVWEIGKFFGSDSKVMRLEGCRFSIDRSRVPDNVITLLLSDQYEKPEREALKLFVAADLPVVELGACVGVVSCLTNKILDETERHVVVEANPAMLNLLSENRERNSCKFEILHRVVAYGADSVDFHIGDNVLASSAQLVTENKIKVPAITLGEIIKRFNFARCTLICDIEGAEVELIDNELNLISKTVAMIIMEIHERIVGEDKIEKMLLSLREAGFLIVSRNLDTVVLQNTAPGA